MSKAAHSAAYSQWSRGNNSPGEPGEPGEQTVMLDVKELINIVTGTWLCERLMVTQQGKHQRSLGKTHLCRKG